MKRSARFAVYSAISIALGLVLALIVITSVTRTQWGMQRVRTIALNWLKPRVQGDVTIGRITGGGLLHGAVLHDVSITGRNRKLFFKVDSARVEYNWKTLVGGSIALTHVTMFRPELHLEELPGDTAWNYQYIFEDTTAAHIIRNRKLIMFDDIHVVNAFATVRFPIPAPVLPGDTARMATERTPRGLMRYMHFDSINGQLNRALWETPLETGRLFDIQNVSGRAYVYRLPTHIASARGKVAMRDTVVTLDFPDVRLPSSRGALFGRVIMEKGRNVFDVQVDFDNFAFHDLDWLYDRLPGEGGGRGRLRIKSLRNGTLFLAENARLTTPGTNVAGTFGVVVGDTVYFTKVDLRASPLDINVIKRMMPNGLPVDGILMGTVEVRGPLSALETKGDMTLTQNGSVSAVKWAGTLDARRRTIGARGIKAEVRDFDLGVIRAMQPRFTLAGRITGTLDATPDVNGIRIAADVQHQNGNGAISSLIGGGLLLGDAGARSLDMTWTARSLSLDELALQYPALKGLTGEITGPVHFTGPLDNLTYRADLTTAGGVVELDGWLRKISGQPRYGGEGKSTSFALQRFDQRLPTGNVSGRFAFDVGGTSMANADGSIRVDLDSARFGPVPVQRSVIRTRLGNGLMLFDTVAVTTIAGDIIGNGALGLTANTSGALKLSMLSESVAGLENDFFGKPEATSAEVPRLAGSLRANASVEGSIYGAAIHGDAKLADVVIGPLRANAATVEINGRAFDSAGATYRAVAHADTLRGYGHTFRVSDLDINAAGDTVAVALTGGEPDAKKLRAGGTLFTAPRASVTEPVSRSFRLAELTLGAEDPWSLEAPAKLEWSNGRLDVEQITLHSNSDSSTADAVGSLMWNDSTSPMNFHFGLHSVDVAEFLRLAHRDLPGAGIIEGSVEVSGTATAPVINGDLAVTDLTYGDLRLDHLTGSMKYANQDLVTSFDARQHQRRVLYGGGNAPVDFRFVPVDERKLARPLSLSFTADSLPLALPLGALPGFTDVAGRVDGTISATGTTIDPALGGSLDVRDGGATWDATGVHYYGVSGTAKLVSDRVVDLLATGRAGNEKRGSRVLFADEDGTADVSGRLDFTTLTDPMFDLKMNATQLLAAKRREADVTMTGALKLGGRYTRPEVTGEITVDKGSLYLDEVYKRYLVVELDPSLLFNVVDTSVVSVRRVLPVSDNPFLKNLLVSNALVHVSPRDSWLRSRDLDVLVSGDLTVAFDRRAADLRMTGTLGVLRGTYNLAYPPLQARRFQVRDGTIEFPGTPGIDPNLSITASYRAPTKSEPLDILAVVSGSLQTPRVRLTSDAEPPISESDLASYLFFGAPSWEVASFRNGTAGLNGVGLRTLAPSVLGYAASGLQTLGQRIGLLDYVGISAAESTQSAPGDVTLNSAFTNFFAATQIDLGLYIRPTVYLGVTQRITGSTGFRVEWRYNPTFTAQMFYEDRFANTPTFGLQREVGLKHVAGFFLFREWGY